MSHVLEPLLKSTLMPDLLRQAQVLMNEESAARAKFLQELTPDVKSEFVMGEVLMHSPAKARHLDVTLNLAYALKHWIKNGGAGRAFVEKCLVSLSRNDFEPDVVWFSPEKAAHFEADQRRFPAPDFVVEVLSESTEERDRGIKFEDYALHGVREYWIIDPDARTVEKYLLGKGETVYALAEKLAHGTVFSEVMAGFEVALEDLFA
jgi:Uma2 family endonuclease